MAEQLAMDKIAEQYGTPTFVYSRAAIEAQWQAYTRAFANRKHLICYAVKANSNLAVLGILARLGSGFDIVSIGELERVLRAGGEASKTVFSGVGKQRHEMIRALEVGIKCFNVESLPELHRLNDVASELNTRAPVSLRINPDVDADTHPYIATGLNKNKFGIQHQDALAVYEVAQSLPNIDITGIDCHIGSQITSVEPFIDAIDRLLSLIDGLNSKTIELQHIDIGGGMGVRYQDETALVIDEFIGAVSKKLANRAEQILIEPGRSIVANAGVLLTRVEYLKENSKKSFAIIDAGMNDLIRPALYDAWQDVLPLKESDDAKPLYYDLVGPICETGDFLALNRQLSLAEGDLLAICSSGAYGFCMSSNYNSRPRAAEVMVDGQQHYEIRQRESIDDLSRGEQLLPDE